MNLGHFYRFIDVFTLYVICNLVKNHISTQVRVKGMFYTKVISFQ